MEASSARAAPEQPQEPRRAAAVRTARSRLIADRVARWAVAGGGMTIIASILGILFFIVIEVAPLLSGASVAADDPRAIDANGLAVLSDEYRSHVAILTDDGHVRVLELADGEWVLDRPLLADPTGAALPLELVDGRVAAGASLLTGAARDGRVFAVPVAWETRFVGDERRILPAIGPTTVFDPHADPATDGAAAAAPPLAYAARVADESATAAIQLADGRLVIRRADIEENMMTGERSAEWSTFETTPPRPVTALVLDAAQRNLYGGTAEGELLWWRLVGGSPEEPQSVSGGAGAVTALSLLIGDRSLVVGDDAGGLGVWFPVRDEEDVPRLRRIRRLPGLQGAIRLISPSLRNKGFLAQDEAGNAGLYYSTSERVLWTGESPLGDAAGIYFAPKSDGAFLVGDGRLAALDIDNPHPEVSLGALFGKVWYEGYAKPDYVWQSSGGTDDFEPKLSLTPLMVGTFKGTIYSLFLAIPLGVLGAMYTSQFMHPSFRRYVKPTVEIMAALPSVVLGFLAGLWLAPRVERMLPALALMLVLLPLLVVAAGLAWRALPRAVRGRVPLGAESLIYAVVLFLGMWLCIELGGAFERLAFGGDVQRWLAEATGLHYDQRNAIVVGLAMGFAVIPIIFSISEDAFSNVPRNLTSGSLALGANRWQTVTRIVLPTASPGIFSAIMIGFGRAVGETMIVLMATGNTPLMDWNPFNGFRTLSANIAVEIPEAPHGDTLYRTLFLAGLILFIFTFVINTVAELVRQRLRQRYAQL
jgi:phosphate transport system permease protein